MEYGAKGASKETHIHVWVLRKFRVDEGEGQVGVGTGWGGRGCPCDPLALGQSEYSGKLSPLLIHGRLITALIHRACASLWVGREATDSAASLQLWGAFVAA